MRTVVALASTTSMTLAIHSEAPTSFVFRACTAIAARRGGPAVGWVDSNLRPFASLASASPRRLPFRSSRSASTGGARIGGNEPETASISSMGKERLMRDMLRRIRDVNSVPNDIKSSLIDFVVGGKKLGKVTPDICEMLCSSSPTMSGPIFKTVENKGGSSSSHHIALTLTEAAGSTCQSRTNAVMSIMSHLRAEGTITGWRDELYPVSEGFYDDPIFLVERVAAPFLGAQEYGVHVNGLVKDDDQQGNTKMWMARRSRTKSKYPGMLDHIVAGGQPAGLGLMENVVKECGEEAGVPELIARSGVRPGGAISYETYSDGKGVISRAVLFCYDLTLPRDFEPKAVDGEVEEFFLWTMDEVMESMTVDFPDPIKPNCYPVIIDFLLREGHLDPEVPGYLDVLRELRGGSCR